MYYILIYVELCLLHGIFKLLFDQNSDRVCIVQFEKNSAEHFYKKENGATNMPYAILLNQFDLTSRL